MYIYRVVNSLTLLSFCCHLRTREMCFICAMLDLAYIYAYIYIYAVDLLQIMLTLPKAHSLLLLLLQLLFFFCLPYAARAKPDSGQPIQCDIEYIVSIAYAMPHGAHTCAYISIYTLCM